MNRRLAALWLTASVALFAASGCVTGHCPHQRPPEPPAAAPKGVTVATIGMPKGTTILVYKADGSLQCGMGQAISLAAMEPELRDLHVVARSKRSDGLMHIQACGQASGNVNAYEIPEMSWATAQRLGFRQFKTN